MGVSSCLFRCCSKCLQLGETESASSWETSQVSPERCAGLSGNLLTLSHESGEWKKGTSLSL